MLSKKANQKRLEKKKKRKNLRKIKDKNISLHNQKTPIPSLIESTDNVCPDCGEDHDMEYIYSILLNTIEDSTDDVCPDCGSAYCHDYIDFEFEIIESSDNTS